MMGVVSLGWMILLCVLSERITVHGDRQENKCSQNAEVMAMSTCQGERQRLSLASKTNNTALLCRSLQQYSDCLKPRLRGCQGPARMAFDVITGKYTAPPYSCPLLEPRETQDTFLPGSRSSVPQATFPDYVKPVHYPPNHSLDNLKLNTDRTGGINGDGEGSNNDETLNYDNIPGDNDPQQQQQEEGATQRNNEVDSSSSSIINNMESTHSSDSYTEQHQQRSTGGVGGGGGGGRGGEVRYNYPSVSNSGISGGRGLESTQQNTEHTQENTAHTQENTAHTQPDTAYTQQGTANTHENTAHTQQGTAYSQGNTAHTQQGTAYSQGNTAYTQENTAHTQQNTAHTQQNMAQQNMAHTQQNTAHTQQDTAHTQQGTAYSQGNTAYTQQNNIPHTQEKENTAHTQENTAHTQQNTAHSQPSTERPAQTKISSSGVEREETEDSVVATTPPPNRQFQPSKADGNTASRVLTPALGLLCQCAIAVSLYMHLVL
ncbi:ras-interacting protein RIP3 [Aplysia californica]|uniref:Ras-interacting protein RIP3 n=1 Tax=Aplysia californica TaxID=6500 RepID=A0ABM0K7L2_APLCA|nr:ras-interacting protein RIP3 [Aplysia californica]